MDCERAANLISARIDGEITSDDLHALDLHLASCEACRVTLDVFTTQDADLQRAFWPHRQAGSLVADRVIDRLTKDRFKGRRFGFIGVALAAAAGFALALVVIQPWKTPPATGPVQIAGTQPSGSKSINQTPPIARLALATGAVEVRPSDQSDWQPLATGGSVAPGSLVRTGPNVRCEFVLSDKSEMRLNASSEVRFNAPRQFDLLSGQIFSSVTAADLPFTVAAAQASIIAVGTQFDVQSTADRATVTVVSGSAKIQGKSSEMLVRSGEQSQIRGGDPRDKQTVENLVVATRWVNELVAMKGRDNAELQKRIDGLFATIGRTKMHDMYEGEIRALGDHCVVPLTRYIQSTRNDGNERSRRISAARIIADVSQGWSIPELIKLLEDPDAEVRYYASRGLERVTGTDLNYGDTYFRDADEKRRAEAVRRWQQWWSAHQDRYPTGPLQAASK